MEDMSLLPVLTTYESSGENWANTDVRVEKILSLTVPKSQFKKNNSTQFTEMLEGPHKTALYLLTNMFSPQNSCFPGSNPNTVNNQQRAQLATNQPDDPTNPNTNNNTNSVFQNAFFYDTDKPRFQCYVETLVNNIVDEKNFDNQFNYRNVLGYRFFVLVTSKMDLNQSAKNVFSSFKKNTPSDNTSSNKDKKKNETSMNSNTTWIEFFSKIWRIFKGTECRYNDQNFDVCELFNVKDSIEFNIDRISDHQRSIETYFKKGLIPGPNTMLSEIPFQHLVLHITPSAFSGILSSPVPGLETHKILDYEEQKEFLRNEMSNIETAIQIMHKDRASDTDILEKSNEYERCVQEEKNIKISQLRLMANIRTKNEDVYNNVPDKDDLDKMLKTYVATLEARQENFAKKRRFYQLYGKARTCKNIETWTQKYKELQLECFNTAVSCLEKTNVYNITKSAMKRLKNLVIDERKSKFKNLCRSGEYFVWLNAFIKRVMHIDYNLLPCMQLLIINRDGCSFHLGLRLGGMIRGETGAGKTYVMRQLENFCLEDAIVRLNSNSDKSLHNKGKHFSGSTCFHDEMSLKKQGLNDKGVYVGSTEQSDNWKNQLTDPIWAHYVHNFITDPVTGDKIAVSQMNYAFNMLNYVWTGNADCPNKALIRRFIWVSMLAQIMSPDSNVANHSYTAFKDNSVSEYIEEMFKNDHALYVLVEEMITMQVISDVDMSVADQVFEIVFKKLEKRGLASPDDTILHFLNRAARIVTIMTAIDSCFRTPHNTKYRQNIHTGEMREFELKDILDIEPYLVCKVPEALMVLSIFRNNFLGVTESEIIHTMFNRVNHWPPSSKNDKNVNFHETKNGKDFSRIEFWQPGQTEELLIEGLQNYMPSKPSEHEIMRAIRSMKKIKISKVTKWLTPQQEKAYMPDDDLQDEMKSVEKDDNNNDLASTAVDILQKSKLPDVSSNFDEPIVVTKKTKIEKTEEKPKKKNSKPDVCSTCPHQFTPKEIADKVYNFCKVCDKPYCFECSKQCSKGDCSKMIHKKCAYYCEKKKCDMVFCDKDTCALFHEHFVIMEGNESDSQPLLTMQRVHHHSKGPGFVITINVGAQNKNWDQVFDEILESINHKYTHGNYDCLTYQNYEKDFVYNKNDPKRKKVLHQKLHTIFKSITIKPNEKVTHSVTNSNYWDKVDRDLLEIDEETITEADDCPHLRIDGDIDSFAILSRLMECGADISLFDDIHPYEQKMKIEEFQKANPSHYDPKKLNKIYPDDPVKLVEQKLEKKEETTHSDFSKRYNSSSMTENMKRQYEAILMRKNNLSDSQTLLQGSALRPEQKKLQKEILQKKYTFDQPKIFIDRKAIIKKEKETLGLETSHISKNYRY